MPSDWKSHAYDSRSPFWSVVPALENWTVSGAVVPEAGVRRRPHHRRVLAVTDVVDPRQLSGRQLGEVAGAVLERVQRVLRPELHVHRVVEDDVGVLARRAPEQMLDIAGEAIAVRAVQLEHLGVVTRPLIEDRLTLEQRAGTGTAR